MGKDRSIRYDYLVEVVNAILADLQYLGISRNEAAELLGMPASSFHAFLAMGAKKNQEKTLTYIKNGLFWSKSTQAAIDDLCSFGTRMRGGALTADPKAENHGVFRIAGPATLTSVDENTSCLNLQKRA